VPSLTVYELIKYLCYAVFAFLVYRSAGTRERVERLVLLIILAGVFEAVYGLVMYLSGTAAVFGWKNRWALGSASGTFVNRDHYSAFLEMVFPLAVGYLLARADFFSFRRGVSLREKILWFGQEKLAKAGILAFVSVVIGLGLFFSRSRSGILIFFLTVFLMAIALSAGGKGAAEAIGRGRRQRARRLIRTVALAVVFCAVTVGIRPIIERFSLESLRHEARPEFYRLTMEMASAFPIFGAGAGTYAHVYAMFEEEDLGGVLEHAHNDYLETLAESGAIGGGSLIALAVGALAYAFIRWLGRRDSFVRGVGLGCMAGVAAVLLHSLTDFSLRMPANAVYCATLYALALRTVGLEGRRRASL
jgi:O-antigen ligase